MKPKTNWTRIILSVVAALAGAGALDAQVIGYWRFDEKAPGNTADTTPGAILDSSGNAYHGSADTGMVYVAASPAHGGTSGLTFSSGNADKIVVPDPWGVYNFTPAQSVTLEAVVRTVTIGQNSVGAIMAKQVASPGEWWWRINATGKQQFWVNDGEGGSKNASGAKVLNDGQWHHLAAVFDGAAQEVRVYADYVLDGTGAAVYTTSGTIGNTNNLWIGAFQAGARQFDGEMDFVRMSMGAIEPSQFVLPFTYLADFMPANNASFVPAGATASFAVQSPVIGVASSNIVVAVNGADVSSQLVMAGDNYDRTVTLPSLEPGLLYRVSLAITDLAHNTIRQEWTFNTIGADSLFIEGEDYNFDGGQFIDDPQLSSVPAADNYLDRLGVEGIDYHQTNIPPALAQYRIYDVAGTAVSQDILRQAYLDAQALDPGVADYVLRENANSEWLNYTRAFPSDTYRVYARLAKPGTVPVVIQVDEVTGGSTGIAQTLAPIGTLRRAPTGGDSLYEFVPLTDALGNEVGVRLSGVKTLRLTFVSGGANVNLNYFVCAPIASVQAPFLASVSPAAGAGNEASNATIQATIRNADTTVDTGQIRLELDGNPVSPSIAATSIGADIAYTPSAMATGLHTAALIFTDSASVRITNSWQFYVANRAVRGHWRFDEKAAGGWTSTNAGAILDSSGNARHGAVSGAALEYITGSFHYGNTTALRFTSGDDRVVVPDPSGNFNFTGSFTFEALVRTTSSATAAAILAKNGTGDGEGEFWWRAPGTAGGVQRAGMNGFFLTGTIPLNDGAWHHVAMVYDQAAAQIRLYADYLPDAVLDGVVTDRIIGRAADLQIGGFIGTATSEFEGDIDFIRMSDGALDPPQFVQTAIALEPIVKVLRPADGAKNVSPTAAIEVELQNRDTSVALNTLRLFVDGADVTAASTREAAEKGARIRYVPTAPLADGLRTATAVFDDTASPANSWTNSWGFRVVSSIPVAGFYPFNEKASGIADGALGAILDASGFGRHGTASSVSGIPYVPGSPNHGNTYALGFTVLNTNHVAVPDPDGVFNWNPSQSVTLEAVVRTANIGLASVGSILAKQWVSHSEWWWRINATGFQQFNVTDGSGGKSVTGAKALNDGEWHHLAVIYDGEAKQLRAYVDYVQDGMTVATTYTSTTSMIGNTNDLFIGQFQNGGRIFEGDIDMVRFTAAALDPSWFIPIGGVAPSVRLTSAAREGSSIVFGFETEAGRSYVVESALAVDAAWSDAETIPGDGAAKTVSYPIAGDRRFFRVRIQ